MKYEIIDLLNDKYKYGLTILRVHKKINKTIIPLLLMKITVSEYSIIHILFIIISSMPLLILSNDFIPDYNKYFYFSNWFRYLTPFSLVAKLQLTHFTYIIICSIMYIFCIIRIIYEICLLHKIYHCHSTESYKLRESNFIRILNHIVLVSFSFIIEFLSFIYYIELFPNDFTIKKNRNIQGIHIIFCVLNAIFIVIYNIHNYIFIFVSNRPSGDKKYPFRMSIPNFKLYILIICQNFSFIHPLQIYIKGKINKLWCIIYSLIILLFLIWVYFSSIKLYNFDNNLNSILSFVGNFCFVSIIVEILLYLLSINHQKYREVVYYLIIKLILSINLFIFLKSIYQKLMIKNIKRRMFYNNPTNRPFDANLTNCILFIRELSGNKKNINYLIDIYGYLIDHKKQCSNYHCGCKIISTKKSDEDDNMAFIEELVKKLNYYIESILVHYNYQNNFELSVLLSEHFYIYKNNPIMSYSILQTFLHYNYNILNSGKLCIIYELMNKYIKHTLLEKAHNINIEKYNNNEKSINKLVKEIELKQYINYLLKMKIANKYMISYSTKFIKIIQHKDNFEANITIKINEIYNEINYITASYLNKKIISDLILFLSEEMAYTSDIQKYLLDLEEYNKILPYEFLFKIFLFADNFWGGEIPDNLMKIYYGFTSNRNLYSFIINSEIYKLLENKYNELLIHTNVKFYLLFKLTKGIKISYISESFTRNLGYKQNDLINNDISLLLIKDFVIPHENIMKYFFILQRNDILKDKFKHIFDNKGYMVYSKVNSIFQIGINKNILIISNIEINKNHQEICFYANCDLSIISINKNFENALFLSFPLIKELNIELKELFGISLNEIRKDYYKESIKIKKIKELKVLDTKEYVLKNLFKSKNQNTNFYISNKFILSDNEEDSDNDNDNEKKNLKVKEKENKQKILKMLQKLYDNKSEDIFHMVPINYQINKDNYETNLKKIIEKINFYEQDKLESKNILKDFLKFNNNINTFTSNQDHFNVIIQPKIIYDTTFYSCKIQPNSFSNIVEINNYKEYEIQSKKTGKEEDISKKTTIQKRKKKVQKQKSLFQKKIDKEDKNNGFKNDIENAYYIDKIESKRVSQYKLCMLLLFCIFLLLISCIIILNYQTNLVHKNDKIFDAIYYNYYQRTQFIYLNSIILSIYYELINITNQGVLKDNQDVLYMIGKNIESSHQLFLKYYMDFKIELDEDFSKLYEPLISNKITVNWENRLFHNDYDYELALIVYRILESVNHTFDYNDIIDCETLLLDKYLYIDSKTTPVYGEFIKLIYYFYINYEASLRNYFSSLESSFDISLNNFSRQTTTVYLILELLALLAFILFFFINIYFLVNSNSYIFRHILYLFIDFTQKKEYSFNNKYFNIFALNRLNNYILLLKDFTPNNLDNFRNNKELGYLGSLKNVNVTVKFLTNEEAEQKNNSEFKTQNKQNKPIIKKPKRSKESSLNISNVLNETKNHSRKDLQELNNDNIHYLNNQNLNLISNNNISFSKDYSTNLILNSSNNNNSSINNSSFPLGSINIINSNNNHRKSDENLKKNKVVKYEEDKDKIKFYEIKEKEKENENDHLILTCDNILFQTKITVLQSIKLIIIIFIIFAIIFIGYFVFKFIVSLLFISNFQNMITDFKTLSNQYNQISLYWNHLKTLFILPNAPVSYDYDNIENYFSQINSEINYIYKYRMYNYKKITSLYDILLSSSQEKNITNMDFCLGHKRCYDIRDSSKYLLSNGIESAVNLYSKEIFSYYKDFIKLKDNIKTIDDIKNYFISDKYKVLSSNINHVVIYLNEFFFKLFLDDEINIVDNFYFRIKMINIIEICYCALLNLFSVLFVYNYITRIISFVEDSSRRINYSIKRMKVLQLKDIST